MRERLLKFIASGLGVGFLPVAPGTAGSLLGVGYWWLLMHTGPWIHWLGFMAGLAFAVWCSGEAAEAWRKPDPSCVVIDEIAVMPLVLAGVSAPHLLAKITLGFVLFRLFDIWKPWPVRQAQALTSGLGIVMDDVLAAVYACVATHSVVWVLGKV
jgi:phosphatidylglycerophosphatase A